MPHRGPVLAARRSDEKHGASAIAILMISTAALATVSSTERTLIDNKFARTPN